MFATLIVALAFCTVALAMPPYQEDLFPGIPKQRPPFPIAWPATTAVQAAR